MVNWLDPAEIQRDATALLNLNHVFFGLVLWEIFVTWDFEWSLLTLQRRLRWPMVLFFFLCRYSIVFAIIGFVISYTATTSLNCYALYTFSLFSLNFSVLCATSSLMLRTLTLWEHKLFMTIPLVTISLGHWGVLLRGAFTTASEWIPASKLCSLSFSEPVFLTAGFFYTMAFQLILLVAACVAMVRAPSKESMLSRLFFGEGLFFFLAFASSSVPAIINAVHLNPVMDVMAVIPASVISSICACRVVLLLEGRNDGGPDPYLHSTSGVTGPRFTFRPQGPHRPEVHVTTEQMIMADEQTKSYTSPETDNGESEFSISDKQLEAQFNRGPSVV